MADKQIPEDGQTAQIPVNEPFDKSQDEPLDTGTIETTPEEKPLAPSNSEIPENINGEVKPEIPETTPDQTQTELAKQVTETKPEENTQKEEKPIEHIQEVQPEPKAVQTQTVIIPDKKNKARELLVKARSAIQIRKRKKLDKVMSLFEAKDGSASSPQVTNDEVEKLLHVSDATATRYLNALEKEGKIKQVGKTGKGVHYVRI